ncbi:hypothetical protein KJ633_06280 [bacterium]|nr:hypothetical protein [bacterium]MBU3956053.1 hypothetical protein [bacterium]
MKKKIYMWTTLIVCGAAVLFFYFRGAGNFKVYDEFGVARSAFPYVNWNASLDIFSAEVSEILDYRTLRTKDGAIIMLYAVARALDAPAAREFMKNKLIGKSVVISVCGDPENYSGIVRAVVFYDQGERCLNKDLYDGGFVDIKIKNKYLFAEEWFKNDAEAD